MACNDRGILKGHGSNHLLISEKLGGQNRQATVDAKTWDLHHFFSSLGEVGHTVAIRRALGAGTERISPIKKQINQEFWLETIRVQMMSTLKSKQSL